MAISRLHQSTSPSTLTQQEKPKAPNQSIGRQISHAIEGLPSLQSVGQKVSQAATSAPRVVGSMAFAALATLSGVDGRSPPSPYGKSPPAPKTGDHEIDGEAIVEAVKSTGLSTGEIAGIAAGVVGAAVVAAGVGYLAYKKFQAPPKGQTGATSTAQEPASRVRA